MKIALIGATGFVGSALLNELADRKHEITAIARTPKDTANATWAAADIFNVDALAEILKGHDAVVNAYNPGWTNPNIYDDFLAGSKAIQEAVKKSGLNVLSLLVVQEVYMLHQIYKQLTLQIFQKKFSLVQTLQDII